MSTIRESRRNLEDYIKALGGGLQDLDDLTWVDDPSTSIPALVALPGCGGGYRTRALQDALTRLPERDVRFDVILGNTRDIPGKFDTWMGSGEGGGAPRRAPLVIVEIEPGEVAQEPPARKGLAEALIQLHMRVRACPGGRLALGICPRDLFALSSSLEKCKGPGLDSRPLVPELTPAKFTDLLDDLGVKPELRVHLLGADAGWRSSPRLVQLLINFLDGPGIRGRPLDEGIVALQEEFLKGGGEVNTYLASLKKGFSRRQKALLRRLGGRSEFYTPLPALPMPSSKGSKKNTNSSPDPDLAVLQLLGIVSTQEPPTIVDPVLRWYLPEPVIIHHVSDVHFGPLHDFTTKPADPSEPTEPTAAPTGAIARPLSESYRDGLDRGASAPHLVFVTGDLTEWCTRDQLEEARSWLDELGARLAQRRHDRLRETDPRVLVVGGNHDVSRDDADPLSPSTKRHRLFAETLAAKRPDQYSYVHPNLHLDVRSASDPKIPNKDRFQLVRYPRLGMSVLLLGSAEVGQERTFPRLPSVAPKLSAQMYQLQQKLLRETGNAHGALLELARLWKAKPTKKLHERLRTAEDTYQSLSRSLEIVDPGLIHEDVLKLMGSEMQDGIDVGRLRIAMLHHPISPIINNHASAQYGAMVNAAALKKWLYKCNVQIVLHGHLHTAQLMKERWPDVGEKPVKPSPMHIVSAPSLASKDRGKQPNGYIELKLLLQGAHFVGASYRLYAFDGQDWESAKSHRFRLRDAP